MALFNTLGKFSTAIQAIPRLSQEYYDLQRSYITSDILQEEVCVCVCVCGCVCGVRVCARVRAYVRATDCTHTHEHRHTHAHTHTHMHVHTHVHTCTSIHKACSTEFQVSFPLRGLRVKTIAPAGAPAGAIVSCLYVCSCVSVSDAPLQRACGVSRLATECFLFLQENTFCLLLQENTFSEFH